jgi:hypothetical protein
MTYLLQGKSIDRKDAAMNSEDFWVLARLRRRSRFENPATELKRSQKPKRPLVPDFSSSLQLLWKCSGGGLEATLIFVDYRAQGCLTVSDML